MPARRLHGLPAVAALSAMAVGAAGSGCIDISAVDDRYVETVEKHFQVSAPPTIMLGTFDGSIDVRSADQADVRVSVEKRASSRDAADRIQVTMEQHEDRIDVDVRDAEGGFRLPFSSRSARIVVTVPARARIGASTGDGRITVHGVEGDLSVRTGDGSIHLERVNGTIEATSGDGGIDIDGSVQRLSARSGDGHVSVRVDAPKALSSDWNITTGDGSVRIEAPDGFGAELDAATGDGRVDVDGLSFSGKTGTRHERTANGRIGTGGGRITVRTGDGSIVVRRTDGSAQ